MVGLFVGLLVGLLIGWLVVMFVGLPVCWSVSRLVGCFRVGWLVCPSVEWVVWLVGSLFVY